MTNRPASLGRFTRAEVLSALQIGGAIALWMIAGIYVVVTLGIGIRNGWLGVDAHAYWHAGRSAVPYSSPPMHVDAYEYSPVFWDILRPFSRLPFHAFYGLWLLVEAGIFVALTTGIRWWWRLPVLMLCVGELYAGNLAGLFSAVIVGARSVPEGWTLPLLTKITPATTGLLWHLARREWRHIARAIGLTVLLVAVSVLAQRTLWVEWLHYLHTNSSGHAANIAIRTAVSAVVIVLAARRGWMWLLPAAFIACTPVSGGNQQYLAMIPATLYLWRRRHFQTDRCRGTVT